LRYNKVLHEHVVTLMVTTQPVPHVPVNRSGFVGGPIPREDVAHGTTQQVFPGTA
jgi:hypothetical protein